MVLGPFFAVLIIFTGIAMAAVGNQLLRVVGNSSSEVSHRNVGVGLMSFGIFMAAFVFIMDYKVIFQVGLSTQDWFLSLVTFLGS
jgi:hypothetical protein